MGATKEGEQRLWVSGGISSRMRHREPAEERTRAQRTDPPPDRPATDTDRR